MYGTVFYGVNVNQKFSLKTPYGLLEYMWLSRQDDIFTNGFETMVENCDFYFGEGDTTDEAAENTIKNAMRVLAFAKWKPINEVILKALACLLEADVLLPVMARWDNNLQDIRYCGAFWFRLV